MQQQQHQHQQQHGLESNNIIDEHVNKKQQSPSSSTTAPAAIGTSSSSDLFHPLTPADTYQHPNPHPQAGQFYYAQAGHSSSSNNSMAPPPSSSTSSPTGTGATASSASRPSAAPRTKSSSSMSSLRSASTSVSSVASSTNTAKLASANNVNNHAAQATTAAQAQAAVAAAAAAAAAAASSPAGSINSTGTKAFHEDEIEASLRQWRNHVFPSLKAGNYVSPGQETPDKDPIHPLVEPILPSIFASSSTSPNARAIPVVYENGLQFLQALAEASTPSSTASSSSAPAPENATAAAASASASSSSFPSPAVSADKTADADENVDKEADTGEKSVITDETGEDYMNNWRLEMILGQTQELVSTNERAEGTWIALWSGDAGTKTRLLEFCLLKLPSRPLVLSSPIPIALLPTALLQDRMQVLLDAYLALPSTKAGPYPFSLVMGPTRVVEAFLLHYDSQPLPHSVASNHAAAAAAGLTGTAGSGQQAFLPNGAEGLFEQSVHHPDSSPYPLKLSHPKYNAALMGQAPFIPAQAGSNGNANGNTAVSSATNAGSGTSTDQLASSTATERKERTRAESAGALSSAGTISALTSSNVPGSITAAGNTGIAAAEGTTPPRPASTYATYHGVYGSGDSGLVLSHGSGIKPGAPARQVFHHSTAAGRTVKPLLHTRAKAIPPAVSLSEGFAVRLAEEKDDVRTLVKLFQAYSMGLDHSLEESAARRALQKAMINKSVWIYHIYSQSLPGLSLIAGFLTTERKRESTRGISEDHPASTGLQSNGSVAITAVFTEEAYRGRGVAESLVRTATRYYLVDLKYDYLSVYADPRNETVCRVFSRVGYGIMDREEKEEIPVKLIRNALVQQWEEEKNKNPSTLATKTAAPSGDSSDGGTPTSAMATATPRAPPPKVDIQAASPTSTDLAAGEGVSKAVSSSTATSSMMVSSKSKHQIPLADVTDMGIEAEFGMPLCRSVEEWQVVSLKSKETLWIEGRSRIRGSARRDESKRLSSEGPWH